MQSFTLVSGLMALGSAAAASFGNATITPSSTVAPTGPTAGVDVTTTVIEVTELTTFCPAPTQITTNGKTITVTAPGTITITDCPCKKTTTVPVPTPNVPVPVKGNDTIVWTTEIVPVLTTFCPAPTEFTQGTKTYTVTKPTTLTITDCPCTISRPVPKPTVVPSFNGTANATTIFTTQTVATLTTFCPAPTTLTNVGTVPIPVLTPGTITVSNQCPCTVVTPIATQPVPVAPQSNPAGNSPAGNTPVAPTSPNSPNTQNGATNRPSSIATGGAGSVGSSIMAWIAAAAFAVAA